MHDDCPRSLARDVMLTLCQIDREVGILNGVGSDLSQDKSNNKFKIARTSPSCELASFYDEKAHSLSLSHCKCCIL